MGKLKKREARWAFIFEENCHLLKISSTIENFKYYWTLESQGKTVDRLLKFSTQCWVSFGSHKCPVLHLSFPLPKMALTKMTYRFGFFVFKVWFTKKINIVSSKSSKPLGFSLFLVFFSGEGFSNLYLLPWTNEKQGKINQNNSKGKTHSGEFTMKQCLYKMYVILSGMCVRSECLRLKSSEWLLESVKSKHFDNFNTIDFNFIKWFG